MRDRNMFCRPIKIQSLPTYWRKRLVPPREHLKGSKVSNASRHFGILQVFRIVFWTYSWENVSFYVFIQRTVHTTESRFAFFQIKFNIFTAAVSNTAFSFFLFWNSWFSFIWTPEKHWPIDRCELCDFFNVNYYSVGRYFQETKGVSLSWQSFPRVLFFLALASSSLINC